MSEYENIMGGKLRLKGRALDVKAGGLKKKKKKKQKLFDQVSETNLNDLSEGMSKEDVKSQDDDEDDANKSLSTDGGETAAAAAGVSTYEDQHLTPAERRYMEQKEKIDVHRLAKIANKSHRDRIQDFNQYLANMSEHYDIPKVGPG